MALCLSPRLPFLLLFLYLVSPLVLSATHAQDDDVIHRHIPIIPSDLIPPSASHLETSVTTATPRHVHGATLAYLTPWNSGGYSVSTSAAFHSRFTHLSPVWFQVKVQQRRSKKHEGRQTLAIIVTGEGDVNADWLRQVRELGSGVKVVPRFLVEMSGRHLLKLLSTPRMQQMLISELQAVIERYALDGLVLEMSDLHAVVRRDAPDKLQAANELILAIGQALHSHSPPLLFVFVVRPDYPRSPHYNQADYRATASSIDFISLMTYDFSSSAAQPGPNSPLAWARRCLYRLVGDKPSAEDRRRVLLGVNMYGMRWKEGAQGPEAVVGGQYTEMLRLAREEGREVSEVWDDASEEMRLEVKGEVVYFPHPRGLQRRVQMANNESCGVSIWEIGQGLEALYDLL